MSKNAVHAQPPSPGPQKAADTMSRAGARDLRRRDVLTGGLAAAAAAPLAALATPAAGAAHPHKKAASGDTRLSMDSAHALYTLPLDHQWHAGGIYDAGLLEEWHYWTGFFTDVDTGEEFGVFYNVFHESTGPGTFRYRPYFSFGDFKAQHLTWTAQVMDVPLSATAPPDSTSPDDFEYHAETSNTSFTTTFRAEPDTWTLHFKSVASNDGGVPVVMDLALKTQTPYGYMPMLPMGVENENQPWTGKPDPSTMSSVSYYIGGPKTNAEGTVTIGTKVRKIKGSLWFEHQWGNFLVSKQPWATSYVWSAIQLNDGSIFTFRQWYSQQNKPLLNLGRNSYSTPDSPTTYGFGESVQWTGLTTWKSPTTGRNYPTQSTVTTPFGTWYYTAIVNNYEMPFGYPPYGNSGLTLWEGPCWIRTGSVTGPIVGKAFLELPNGLTATYPPQP